MELLRTALTALFSITALFVITKLIGYRQMAQMSTFDYINGEKNQRGLIAEDVYNIIPSMVQGDIYADDDDYEAIMGIGIDYSKAVPYLIKAIQTMRKELDEMKATQ